MQERAKMDSTSESSTKKHEIMINLCITLSAYVVTFPEAQEAFAALIPDLVAICRDKLDQVRLNAAALLAKLCQHEGNAEIMRANHGTEVLVSIGGAVGKQL